MNNQFSEKVKILLWLIQGTYQDWKDTIWIRDLDDSYCCDGRDCCCGGMTIRELYKDVSRSKR